MRKTIETNGYYLPPGFFSAHLKFGTQVFERGGTRVHLRMPEVSGLLLADVAAHVRQAQGSYLYTLPVERIIDVLDRASRRWLDKQYPARQTAIEAMHVLTGFSREMIAASIDLEMESSRKDDMWRALCSEIKNPLYLDDFQRSADLNGWCRAYGPGLVVSFFSENIPALPHLVYMRSALVKAACIGKAASGEPVFAPLYLHTIEELDPGMAACMAALSWRGGSADVERAAFDSADAFIVFGGVEACDSLLGRIPRSKKVLVHGHKIGFGIIGRTALNRTTAKDLAAAIAEDHAMFDQQACLAPQAYYVERGGEVGGPELAELVARALAQIEQRMPRGAISAGEAAALHQFRTRAEVQEIAAGERVMCCSPGSTKWTVVCEQTPQALAPSPGNRTVRLWMVDDIFDLFAMLQPVQGFLQNAAVAVGDAREVDFIRELGTLGVCRITAPGMMPLPSMMWHHDGIAALSSLLRWCDIEKREAPEGLE